MPLRVIPIACLVSLLLAGCSLFPREDASNPISSQRALKKMTRGLSDEEKADLMNDWATVVSLGHEGEVSLLTKMSAEEVHDRAEELRTEFFQKTGARPK